MQSSVSEVPVAMRLEALRAAMSRHQLDALIIPSNDPHQSEYVAEHWAARTWITGFTGSAGTAIITQDHAGLWTDSRYFIQAEQELAGSPVTLHRQVVPHAPEHRNWLMEQLSEGARVGIDGKLLSIASAKALSEAFAAKDIELVTYADPVAEAWDGRPKLPVTPIFDHPVAIAGQSRGDKLAAVRAEMDARGIDWHLVTPLDDIAWLFNLRGSDVDFNPVYYAYALVGQHKAVLFIDPDKVDADLRAQLEADEVTIAPYRDLEEQLEDLGHVRLGLNPGTTSVRLRGALHEDCIVVHTPTLSTAMKGRKNATEIGHLRKVMVRDGIALLRLYRWLDAHIDDGNITEAMVAEKLNALRGEQEGYRGESFSAIAGYAGNGAIVHYRPQAGKDATLKREGIFLLDSGGQYIDGTTDITRTVALGPPTAEQKRNYTLVLKGHIALGSLRFPAGTAGFKMDTLARMHLWRHGLDYGHGTGHGVGFFLNVHEGPQSIRGSASGAATVAFETGMITSNEPGFYKAGEYGIRIENLVLCVEWETTDFGTFLAFEDLTLFPIATDLIDFDLVTKEEREWLNAYHEKVLKALGAELEGKELAWLQAQCKPV